jgi:hypothetical protein
VAYTGRKIRIVPASPFLQLSRVHAVSEVQSAIPRVAPPPLYRQALVPLPLAVQQQMQQAKLVNNSLLNKPDVPDAELEEQEERAPVLFLENGTYPTCVCMNVVFHTIPKRLHVSSCAHDVLTVYMRLSTVIWLCPILRCGMCIVLYIQAR